MAKERSRARIRKKPWSLWEERRLPNDYEAVTHRFHYHFRREPAPFELSPQHPINQWYQKYREGSPFQVDDWEQFRDPAKLDYRSYVFLQKERELYVDGLIDTYEREDHYKQLTKDWVDLLEIVYIPSRYSGHVLQMAALYWAQMAPSAYITNGGYFQGGDELRRLQRSAYLAKALSLDHGEHLADTQKTRAIWENDIHWQPMRELMEKLLTVFDWGEAFTVTNLLVKPTYDALMNDQLAELAERNGDMLLSLMLTDFKRDSERARQFSIALVQYALKREPKHKTLLLSWTKQWAALNAAAIEGLAALFSQAPHGKAKEEVVDQVLKDHQALLVQAGLD